ncbi:hypothetical protein [Xenorhabdus szentirmaii]|uniref:hypothetical protein n=1 Tax=Xenorhabdus szentirmaii TaxID=290112 RepID=UPI000C05D09A|nr:MULTISPECIES: hypothetical protein [Xenorhabdus]MBD2822430.1 hypothetical protein [Xenorhabdus sp. 42]PHM30889.1 hypothetical protein Xsze_04005 [Xenorhabdus szentirmaii DSM 16338]PHM40366.1 hypothetical protein Xszus_00023 [Xenorhabdus szentirmaii]
MDDNIVYADGKYQLTTRVGGLMQAAGGAVEIIGGTVFCATPATCVGGAIVATQGMDNLNTGTNILTSGKPVKTMGEKGLEALGVPPEYSEITYAGIGLGGSLTTVLTSPKTGKSVTVLMDKDNRITRSFSNNSGTGNKTENSLPQSDVGTAKYVDKNTSSKIPSNPTSQASSGVWKPADSNLYVDGVLSKAKVKEIVNTPHGQRPDPSTYMTKAEIDAHLAKFNDGEIRFTSKSKYEQYGTYGTSDAFVMPKSEFERVMIESKGNLRIVEQKLGLDKGYLSGSDTLIVHVEKKGISGLKIPSGNEGGANSHWLPGGYTSGGVAEATMNFANKPNVTVIELEALKKQLTGKIK